MIPFWSRAVLKRSHGLRPHLRTPKASRQQLRDRPFLFHRPFEFGVQGAEGIYGTIHRVQQGGVQAAGGAMSFFAIRGDIEKAVAGVESSTEVAQQVRARGQFLGYGDGSTPGRDLGARHSRWLYR